MCLKIIWLAMLEVSKTWPGGSDYLDLFDLVDYLFDADWL
jgi:hypothetical protein